MKRLLQFLVVCNLLASEEVYATRADATDTIRYTLAFNALALKPSGDFNYAAQASYISPASVTPPVPTPSWTIFDLNPGYAFGFEIDFNLYIPEREAFIANSFEHFKSIQSNGITTTSPMVIGAFFGVGQEQVTTQATTQFTFNLNEFNMSYVQPLVFKNKYLEADATIGLSIAGVKQIKNTEFSNATLKNIMIIDNPSEFIGAGLRLGTNFSYEIVRNFAFQGTLTGALLVGGLSSNQTFTTTEPGIPADTLVIGEPTLNKFKQAIMVEDRFQVVPSFLQRIGLSYKLNKNDNLLMHIEAGYQVQIYMDAIQSTDISSQVIITGLNHIQDQPPADGASAKTFQRNTSNFALAGPYFNFMVIF